MVTVMLSQIEQMMHELGPITPQISQIVQEADDQWSLNWDGIFWISIEFNPERSGLLFWTTLGKPVEDQILSIYETMLVTNSLYAGIGSLRIALSHPGEDLLLFGEHVISHGITRNLRSDISSFAAHALSLAEVVSNPVSASIKSLKRKNNTETLIHSLA